MTGVAGGIGRRSHDEQGGTVPAAVFSRTTAGAAALVLSGDRLLLVRQQRRTGVRWEVPGGGQEPGESLEETAVREVAEEAGIPVGVERLVCTYVSYRAHTGTVVLGGFYLATPLVEDAIPLPQVEDGIVEADYLDPLSLGDAELGPLTRRVLDRWWDHRHQQVAPFHVELWRDQTGYVAPNSEGR